jgi:SAM-dependent methyltransferase
MADDTTERAVSAHYGAWSLIEVIEKALRDEGIDPEHATIEQLSVLDHFHSYGVAGTLELERRAGITGGGHMLDVGGGVGGPARTLASRYDCAVTVLDVTPEFCQAGEVLTGWTKLSDHVSFVCGSALDMPFADESFDVVWTIHAAMNIGDKPRLYHEIHRVLRPAGRFALFDTMAGSNHPVYFPVPWADDPAYSFLLPPDEVRALITAAGFVERDWLAGRGLVDLLEQSAPAPAASGAASTSRPSTALLMGPGADAMIGNAVRNTREGRTTLGLGIFERM